MTGRARKCKQNFSNSDKWSGADVGLVKRLSNAAGNRPTYYLTPDTPDRNGDE
jgi:hypothetical protein